MTNDPQASTFSTKSGSSIVAAQRATDAAPHEYSGARDFDRLAVSRYSASVPEESLVIDDRSAVTPAQMVETKLMSLLQGSSLPVSHLQMRGLLRGRPGD